MADVLKSLATITTGYCHFEEDQILTHTHLNDLAGYFDDQDRLTRIALHGVGLVHGLVPSVKANKVTVTKGLGITTDGDLLQLWTDTVFEYVKVYGPQAPTYAAFSGLTAYELLASAGTDPLAYKLSEFTATTRLNLSDMVAVLYMESYVKDEDACSGTDCDNKGQNALNTTKVLLFEKAAVTKLKESIATMDGAARAIDPTFADRVVITTRITSAATLATAYRTACNKMHTKLATLLPKAYLACKPFLTGVFATDPSRSWTTALTAAKAKYAASTTGIQYYYAFLKDLIETYNALRDKLFGDTFVNCPDLAAFPKHLLLGPIVGVATSKTRAEFYPSPVVAASVERWRQVQALARKIDTMIKTFAVPTTGTVTITPSAFEDRPLEERAIPWYYAVSGVLPHRDWNYTLTQRGMDRYNYSYHAPTGGALGAAAAPLSAQIGAYPLFRIEGCLGQDVETAKEAIEDIVEASNLPFDVRAVLLGTDSSLTKAVPGRYTDLHRVHHLLRKDLAYQLDDVKSFSATLKSTVDSAVDDGTVSNSTEGSAKTTVKQTTATKNTTVRSKATSAKSKINTSFDSFIADDSWKTDLNDTLTAAGEFKYEIGTVLRTDFPSPFDSLISSSSGRMLDWVGEIIADADEKAAEALLFANFVSEHPGVEHVGGVLRGGTFILVYDSTGAVVADFMLPYRWPDEPSDDTEPTLSVPTVKSDWVLSSGVKAAPTMEATFDRKWGEVEPDVAKKTEVQEDYYTVLKDSMTLLNASLTQSISKLTGA